MRGAGEGKSTHRVTAADQSAALCSEFYNSRISEQRIFRYLDWTRIGQCMTGGINAVVVVVGEWVDLELLMVVHGREFRWTC